MKITIFGANGAIGKIVTSHAIRKGDMVTAYVRNSESLVKTKNLNIVVGNFSNQLLIEEVIIGSDVVISTLGPAHDLSRKIKGTPIADGHEIIINAMEKKELEGTLVTRFDDRYQWPLLLAILLIAGEFFVTERKKTTRGGNDA